jgi:hypothetical protein
MGSLSCYLCGSTNNIIRRGSVRDSAEIKPLECIDCGLVFFIIPNTYPTESLCRIGHAQWRNY